MKEESKEYKQGYECAEKGYNRNFYDGSKEPERYAEWARGWNAYFNLMKRYYK